LLIAGHAINQRPRYATRSPKTDVFPPTQTQFSRHSPWLLIPGHAINQRPRDATGPPRTHPSPPTQPQFSRHSPWLLIAGDATNRRPCDATGPPQTDPSHPFPATLKASSQFAHRWDTSQIGGLAVPPHCRRQILPTHPLPLSRHSPCWITAGEYHKSTALPYHQTAADRSLRTHTATREASTRLLTAGHATNQRPCYTTRPPETDAFPPTQPLFARHSPDCSPRGLPQISGLAMEDDRRGEMPSHPHSHWRGLHLGLVCIRVVMNRILSE
jgi:hypothetical protein